MDDKEKILSALNQEPQTEPADEMGTYGMGPGSEGDKPLSASEIAALVKQEKS